MTLSPPTEVPGLTWRPVTRLDLASLCELAQTCQRHDGGLAFLNVPETLQDRYFPEVPGAGTGTYDQDGCLAACATVHQAGDGDSPLIRIVGQVHPKWRGNGIGEYLMRWSLEQAQSLAAGNGSRVFQVATESLTDSADRLYRKYGFAPVMEALIMERDLRMPLPYAQLPEGVVLSTWKPELAEQFYQAYYASFKDRPGFPGWSASRWFTVVTSTDLMPEWTLLASLGDEPLGYVIGTIDLVLQPPGGELWQICTVPEFRRKGLASALMVESMRRMRSGGAINAELTVHTNNPGAIQTYSRLGFQVTGRRARYERVEQ